MWLRLAGEPQGALGRLALPQHPAELGGYATLCFVDVPRGHDVPVCVGVVPESVELGGPSEMSTSCRSLDNSSRRGPLMSGVCVLSTRHGVDLNLRQRDLKRSLAKQITAIPLAPVPVVLESTGGLHRRGGGARRSAAPDSGGQSAPGARLCRGGHRPLRQGDPAASRLPDAARQALEAHLERRRQVVTMITAEKNRLGSAAGPVRKDIQPHCLAEKGASQDGGGAKQAHPRESGMTAAGRTAQE